MIWPTNYAVFSLAVYYACAQVPEDDIPDSSIVRNSNRPRPSDPVQTFLSGLGNLILDIDETFSRQTAPKVNAEDEMKERMYGRPRSGVSYFNRIRENYRDIQRRLGESLGIVDLSMSSDLGSVNIQNKGLDSSVDVSLPSTPVKLAVSSKQGFKAPDNSKEATDTEPEQISPFFRSSFKLGNTEFNMDSKLDQLQPSELLKNVENQIKKALEDIRIASDKNGGTKTEETAQEKLVKRPKLENELNLEKKEISSRSGDEFDSSKSSEADYSSPEGRILGDVLYSESAFDKLTKRLMKDAKWVIDPKVFPSDTVEKLKQFSDKATESILKPNYVSAQNPKKTEETTTKIQKRDSTKQDFKRKTMKPLSNDLETALNDQKINFIPQQDIDSKFEILDGKRQKDSIVLAFTPEGVPLKLRMGPEVTNPLKFLHKILRTYGVSLNIPVVSYDDIEPVGREILQLGTGSGGTMTRALYIDLSDSFQLESLLRSLKRTKMLQEM